MKTKLKILLIASLLMLLAAACGSEAEADSPADDNANKAILVEIEKLAPQQFASYLNSVGTVKARNHVRLMVEEGGILKKILIDKGRFASKGDTLAILENKAVTAGYHQAVAALKQAELNHTSRKVLYSKKAISENEYLAAKYNLDASVAARDLAAARYEKLFITAPLSGLVNDRYYDLGAYAQPMTPIFEQIDNQHFKVTAGVAERFLGYIDRGTPVTVMFDAFPDIKLDAKVSYVSRSIDPQNRTFKIEVEIPNANGRLAPEMIANIRILKQSFKEAIVVPIDALVESEGGWYVFVADQGMAKKVMIDRKAIYKNDVLVDGLKAGEELIIVGQHHLSNGDNIKQAGQ